MSRTSALIDEPSSCSTVNGALTVEAAVTWRPRLPPNKDGMAARHDSSISCESKNNTIKRTTMKPFHLTAVYKSYSVLWMPVVFELFLSCMLRLSWLYSPARLESSYSIINFVRSMPSLFLFFFRKQNESVEIPDRRAAWRLWRDEFRCRVPYCY